MEKNDGYHINSGSESPDNLHLDPSAINKTEVSILSVRLSLDKKALTFSSFRRGEVPRSPKRPTSLAILLPQRNTAMSLVVSSPVTSSSSLSAVPSAPVSSWVLAVPSSKPVLFPSFSAIPSPVSPSSP